MRLHSTLAGGILMVSALSPASAAEVDFTSPEAVTTAIFEAAQTGDSSALATLCDPRGENDGDTQEYICEMTAGSANWDEYVSYFAKGKLNGPAEVNGLKAKVPFLFGPDGTDKETMNLIQRDGKWYLSSF
ncbi:MAG: hypothetical protein AAF557_16425 [Pseudomonadota bacterium]